ncbi:lysophospholipid acyltransferase family protein [Desulfogranum mediterraneum]|uniref:lysophospholipid acyltransferase family protein n=1 Tax=Desulfogranum mediterraneum TaxID=160661 RepID=UPI00041A49C6|nr:lysophospholipid acyltransferase family protein [Desulfogranum mediterraneum]
MISFVQYLRGIVTLVVAVPMTFGVSLLAWLDMTFFRRSMEKAAIFPLFWGRAICWLAGVRVEVEGLEHIEPEQTYIFAANHSSQFDIFCFQGYFPHSFKWIAKKELFRIPIFGQTMTKVGFIPIDRSRGRQAVRSLDDAAKRIAAGSSVLIFPEGTRSDDGRLQEFKGGAILLAIKAGVPVVPLGINGSYQVLPKGRWLAKSGTVVIRIGEPQATDHYKSKDKQALAQSLHRAVGTLLDSTSQAAEDAPGAAEQL